MLENKKADTNQALFAFIESSPSPFHTIETLSRKLQDSGYKALHEHMPWKIEAGGAYYVTRNQSSLIAFRIPEGKPSGFQMCAAHGDSPSFFIKRNPEVGVADAYVKLDTEKYGGMICSTWMDRPLSVAGRVVVREEGRIVSRLVNADRDLMVIPSVAIHMNRNMNEGVAYNAAVDMFPLVGTTVVKGGFRELIADLAGAAGDAVLGSDLYLYNRMPGTVVGLAGEFICAPRLDDLQCAFSAAEGFLSADTSSAIPVLAVLDNEEVGSQTKQGAAGTFLYDVLRRVCSALGADYRLMVAGSFLVSADNAHSVHPNHPEYADANHRCRMNGGVVIKHNANQKYVTDAVSTAVFTSVCSRAGVPVQYFANRSDMAGGSTLGNIANTQVSLNGVDIGLAQLAMHSAYETAGAADTDYMIRALREYYSCAIIPRGNGEYGIE